MSSSTTSTTPGPPYTPGFGVVPHALAGREHLLVRYEAALRRGPRDPFFTQAIVGDRGVGKTVFLSVLAARMIERHRWTVLRYQVRRNGATVAEILGELPEPPGRRWRTDDLRALERQVSAELNTGLVRLAGSGQALSLRSSVQRRSHSHEDSPHSALPPSVAGEGSCLPSTRRGL